MTRTARSLAGKAALGAAVSAALVLAGCSGTPTEPASQGPVTLEMSWWGDDNRAALFKQVIDLFTAEYPYITVKQTPVGAPDDLFNRLATDFGAGGTSAPDVFALGGAKPQEYGDAGQLLDLDTVKEWLDITPYPEASLTNAIVDDKLYGLPTGGNATAAFINKGIFEQAGVALPTDGWTWSDFVTAANAIGSKGLKTADGKAIYGVDLRVQDILGTFAGQETETGVYDWDGNVSVGADTIAKWYDIEKQLLDGKGLPAADVVTANWALTPDQQPFTLGQAGITFGYSNLAGAYSASGANDIEILVPPTNTSSSGVALLPSAFWSINAATKHPKESALLVNWFLNEPAAAELIKDSRGVQFNATIADHVASLLEGPGALAAAYVAKVSESGIVAPPQPNGGANFNKYSQDAETQVLFGQKSSADAAAELIQKLTADVDAAK